MNHNDNNKPPADVIFTNGKVYTLDRNRSWAEAVAIQNGKIVYVGDNAGVKVYTGPQSRMVDLADKMMLPGFIDSHAHVSGTPNPDAVADLNNLTSRAELIAVVKRFADTHPEFDVIYGSGWKNELFPATGPVKEDLDAAVLDRPVSLMSEDGHSAWVNTIALDMAGVTGDTVNPRGGVIEKDPATAKPGGTLRETARDFVQNRLPPLTVEQVKGSIRNFLMEAARVGITTAHDPLLLLPQARGQLNGFGAARNNIQAYQELVQDHELTIRVRGTILTDPTAGESQIQEIAFACAPQKHALFQMNGLKVFVDGVVEGGTAFLSEPYANMPETCGEPLWDTAALSALCAAADREQLQIHIHAIGDAAVSMALDALEYAQRTSKRTDSRHLITHLHVVDRTDIPRMAALNVIGVPQTFWHVKGEYFRNIDAKYLGTQRAELSYPMRSLVDAGILIAAASDYPVQVPSPPLLGIMLGVTRCEPGETDPLEVLGPEERLTLKDMLAAYTINGAYANYLEHETGSLEVGKKADMVVLEKNLFDIPASEIADTQVMMTVFEGDVVYGDESV